MKASRITIGALALVLATPALACSGLGLRGHIRDADVIVAGRLLDGANAEADVIATKTVLKGKEGTRYLVFWPGVSADDECAFLSPVVRDQGVYFLKLVSGDRYLVIWTEKRWDKRWGRGL